MNKITKYNGVVTPAQFKTLVKQIFEESFDIEEEFHKHSECRVKLGAEIDLVIATLIHGCVLGTKLTPEDLVGVWMVEASRSYSNGVYWDEVDEIVKVHKVTKQITVTEWKPLSDETVPTSN